MITDNNSTPFSPDPDWDTNKVFAYTIAACILAYLVVYLSWLVN